jgi:poly(A) polymerase
MTSMEIRLDQIDPDALRVVQRLRRYQHKAYLVGGCVRDLLLGRKPKDFDVATSATPNEIRRCFRNCRIIGRRFRLAHVFFGRKIIETATFRANPRAPEDEPIEEKPEAALAEKAPDLLIRRDNVFGSEEEDARRRDFTINGLFFDVETAKVIDHVGGLPDLEARLVRTIGDPDIRFREDPVRILRAVKFAARCDLTIEAETYQRMMEHKAELAKCAQARVTEEIYRLLRAGAARRSFELLIETGLLEFLLPELAAVWRNDVPENEPRRERFWAYLRALDDSIVARGETPSDAMILATILLPPLRELLAPDAKPEGNIAQLVAQSVGPILERLKASRRDSEVCRQILLALRYLLPGRRPRRQYDRLAGRSFYPDAVWLAALVARAEGVEPSVTVDTEAASATTADASNDDDLPAELLVDVDGPSGRDRRARRDHRGRRGGDPRAEPVAALEAPVSAGSLAAAKSDEWQPGQPPRTPIPSLDDLPRLLPSKPAFLGLGAFGGRWSARTD